MKYRIAICCPGIDKEKALEAIKSFYGDSSLKKDGNLYIFKRQFDTLKSAKISEMTINVAVSASLGIPVTPSVIQSKQKGKWIVH